MQVLDPDLALGHQAQGGGYQRIEPRAADPAHAGRYSATTGASSTRRSTSRSVRGWRPMKGIYELMVALSVLDLCLLGISAIPAFRNAEHGADWVIGGIGWFGFWLGALVLVVLAAATLVRGARRRRAASA
jgi:hypothetical protein